MGGALYFVNAYFYMLYSVSPNVKKKVQILDERAIFTKRGKEELFICGFGACGRPDREADHDSG